MFDSTLPRHVIFHSFMTHSQNNRITVHLTIRIQYLSFRASRKSPWKLAENNRRISHYSHISSRFFQISRSKLHTGNHIKVDCICIPLYILLGWAEIPPKIRHLCQKMRNLRWMTGHMIRCEKIQTKTLDELGLILEPARSPTGTSNCTILRGTESLFLDDSSSVSIFYHRLTHTHIQQETCNKSYFSHSRLSLSLSLVALTRRHGESILYIFSYLTLSCHLISDTLVSSKNVTPHWLEPATTESVTTPQRQYVSKI